MAKTNEGDPNGSRSENDDTLIPGVGDGLEDATLLHSDQTLSDAPTWSPSHSAGEGARAPVTAVEPGKLFADRFQIEETLGQGGMGLVYLARDTYVDQREVALKVLRGRYSRNEKFRQLFFREIKTAQRFVSEHVNQVRDTGQAKDGTLYLTMDLVKGEDLSALLGRENTLNVRHALDVTLQMLHGLQSGHEVGFVHRDIKPSNVMLAERITKTNDNPFGVGVRLLDFGIAGFAAEIEDGELVGTPTYMSPEQVQGERLDARSDLFAVGVVLYEMIAGARPFEGKTVAQITSAILEQDMDPMIRDLSQLSKPLQDLLSKALEKNREKRFQSAGEFITAIEKSKAYKLPRVMPTWAAALLVLFLGAAVVEGFLLANEWKANAELTGDLNDADDSYRTLARQKDQEIASLRGQLDQRQVVTDDKQSDEIDQVSNEIDQVALDDLRSTNEQLARENQEVTVQRDDALEQRRIVEQEKVDLERRITALEGDKLKADARITTLENEQDRANAFNDPHWVIAKAFDERLLAHWQRGFGRRSLITLEDLIEDQAVDGVLAGKEYLHDVAELVAHLEGLSESNIDQTTKARLIADIVLVLPRLRSGLDAFAIEAKEWLERKTGAKGEIDNRLGALQALLESESGLLARAETARMSESRERDDTWNAIMNGDALQSPSEVLVFASKYGESYLAQELERFVSALRNQVFLDDVLDRDKLVAIDAVDEWADALAASPVLSQTEVGRDLLRLQHAQRWFDEPDYLGQGLDPTLLSEAAETDAWAAELKLCHELVQPRSSFPAVAGGRLVYRTTYKSNARTVWRIEEQIDAKSSAGLDARQVRIQIRSSDGANQEAEFTQWIERRDKIFQARESRKEILRLDGKSPLAIEARGIPLDAPPPPQIVSGQDWTRFGEQLKGEAPLCLVSEVDGTKRWISPTYGLLYEENANSVLELVFGSYAR